MRQNNIGLLNYLLGFQGQNQPWQQGGGQPPASQGGPMQRPGPGGGGVGIGQGGSPWQIGGAGNPGGGGAGNPWSIGGQSPGGRMQAFGGGPSMDPGNSWSGAGGMQSQLQSAMQQAAGGNPAFQQGLAQWQQGGGFAPGGNGAMDVSRGGSAPSFNMSNTGLSQIAQESPTQNGGAPGGGGALDRLQSYFGQLGTPTTALQQQSLGGISQFLNSNPYGQSNTALQGILGGGQFGGSNKAYGQASDMFKGLSTYNPFGAAQTSMEGLLGTNPGMQGMDALRPLLDRNLAAANQQGGRFGSANAILRSRAVDDNNLLASQMYQRGVDQQIAAAGQYGAMGNSLIGARGAAGQGMLGVGQGMGQNATNQVQGQLGAAQGLANNQNSMFGNLMGGYGIGQQQATQDASAQQQAIQMMLGLLGTSQSASMGGPTMVQPTGAQQGIQMGGGIAQILAQYLGQQGGGGTMSQRGNYTQSMGG